MKLFNYRDTDGNLRVSKIGLQVFFLLALFVVTTSSIGTVPSGSIGVKTRFSAVIGQVNPGLYMQVPFIENVVSMDTQKQKEQVDATAASNDLQQVTATVAINFHVNPEDASQIYQSIGVDYQVRVIDPAIQESIKAVTANYTAEQLVTQREKARDEIFDLLKGKLQPLGVNADSLNIINFQFSETFNAAIEAKVTAQQNALAAQNKLAQVQFEAQQTVAKAKADAEAIQIQAQAINSQGGADYVQLQAVSKWDGHLPTQMIPGGTVPFLNLKN